MLGKHSGRNAFRSRLCELGFDTTDAEIAECYRLAIERADAEKEVTDRDLVGMILTRCAASQSLTTEDAGTATSCTPKRNPEPDYRTPVIGRSASMTELRKTIAVLPGDGIGPEMTRARCTSAERLRRSVSP